jgi:hypothetical protein
VPAVLKINLATGTLIQCLNNRTVIPQAAVSRGELPWRCLPRGQALLAATWLADQMTVVTGYFAVLRRSSARVRYGQRNPLSASLFRLCLNGGQRLFQRRVQLEDLIEAGQLNRAARRGTVRDDREVCGLADLVVRRDQRLKAR